MPLLPAASQLLRAASPTLLAALALPPPINALASAVASTALQHFAPDARGPLSPAEVAQAVEAHANDPALLPALRQAEIDLNRYEEENRFRFAELDSQDRANARDLHAASGIAARMFAGGIWLVWLAVPSRMIT